MLNAYRFLLFVCLSFCPNTLSSCSCINPPVNFDVFLRDAIRPGETLAPEDSVQVVSARIVNRHLDPTASYLLAIDVVVMDYMRGSLAATGDTLTFIGQDGLNCGYSLDDLPESDAFVFLFWGLQDNLGCVGCPDLNLRQTELSGCGPSVLSLNDGVVTGPITWDAQSMSLEEFRANLEGYVQTVSTYAPLIIPDLKIFPLPANDYITVYVGEVELNRASLFSSSGQIIQQLVPGQANSFQLAVDQLPAGVYYLRLMAGNRTLTRKVVVGYI